MRYLSFILFAALIATACVNNFARFYSDSPVSHNITLAPYSGTTKIYSTSDAKADTMRLAQDGYVRIGVASFQTTGRVTVNQIRDQAKAVGADIVLWNNSFLGTEQAVVPFFQYQPGATTTTNTYGTANATANYYGSNGGYGTANGTATFQGYSTTTSPGTINVQSMRVTRERYAYGAAFFRKSAGSVFGVYTADLPPEVHQRLQRNGGVQVTIVVSGTPAFRANILPGDIITELDDWPIDTANQFPDVIGMERGKLVKVSLIRDGSPKVIPVQFNP